MNYASKDLITEHEGILFGLKILGKMVAMLKAGKDIDTGDLRDIVEFFKLFADKCHHGKEEGMFFPEMEKAGIPRKNGPIGQMLNEHVDGRKYISQMSASLENRFRSAEFIESAQNYIRLLGRHIEKENNILFPLGDKKIPMKIQEKLLKSFEKYEEEVMGKGTHEKLHELLHEFEHKYMGKE